MTVNIFPLLGDSLLIVLAGFVFLWGGVFQRLLAQPAAVESRN